MSSLATITRQADAEAPLAGFWTPEAVASRPSAATTASKAQAREHRRGNALGLAQTHPADTRSGRLFPRPANPSTSPPGISPPRQRKGIR